MLFRNPTYEEIKLHARKKYGEKIRTSDEYIVPPFPSSYLFWEPFESKLNRAAVAYANDLIMETKIQRNVFIKKIKDYSMRMHIHYPKTDSSFSEEPITINRDFFTWLDIYYE